VPYGTCEEMPWCIKVQSEGQTIARCCRRRRARQRPRPHENDRARASLDHPLAPPTRSGRPRGGRRGCRGGGQVTNSRSHTPRPGPASQTAGAGPHLIVTSLALAASESTRTQFTIYRSVFFFVLCNQHRFNSIPGPPPRDELGCTHIYPPPLAQTLAMPTYP